jgi:hypothetical protein
MRPEDMNIINSDGKAFNGNRGALIVAAVMCAGLLLGAGVKIIAAIFS